MEEEDGKKVEEEEVALFQFLVLPEALICLYICLYIFQLLITTPVKSAGSPMKRQEVS